MAIPRLDAPQVGNAPLDAARLSPGMAPNAGVIGQGLQNAAQGFAQIQREADVMRVTEAFNPFESDAADIVLKASQVKGKQVADPEAYGGDQGASLTETALANLEKAKTARMEGLNPQQQQMFEAAYQRKRAEVQRMVNGHETQQLGEMFKQIYADRDTVLADNISKLGVRNGLPDGETINANLADRVDNARRWASSQGLDPDLAAKAATADTYRSVISGLLVGNNAQAAQAYFSDHKMDLDEKTRLHLEQVISQHVMANDVQTMAQEVAASGKPLDQQLAWVDEKTKGNAALQKSLSAEVEHRFQVKERARVAAEQDAIGKLWDMRFPTKPGQQAVGMPQIMRSPEWLALDGEKRNQLRAQWESYARRNENAPNRVVDQNLAYFNVRNSEGFANLTDNQIRALQGELGPDLTVQLMKDLQKVRTSPKHAEEVKLDAHIVEAAARKFGIISGDTPTKAEKAAMGQMQAQAMQIIQASGQEWDYGNQVKLFEQLSQKIVTERGWFSDTKVPLFQLRETVGIPPAFLSSIKARAARLGQPEPSDAMAYQLWFDAKEKGLVDESGNPTASSGLGASPVTGANK